MEELFASRQPLPAAPTTGVATTAGNHLAAIVTTMSMLVTGLTSKTAANHANVDQEETIYFKDMPANIYARYALKKHPVDLIRRSDMALYTNVFTTDKHSAIRQWRTVEYSKNGIENTTKHDGQT